MKGVLVMRQFVVGAFVAGLFVAGLLSNVHAQEEQKYFGQNKVQYKDYKWNYLQSEHFDIYFYEGGKELAAFAADAAESAYVSIIANFKDYEIQNRIAFVIYNSHNQFQQTNVLDEYLSEGIGGVTELFKNRIVLPYEGDYEKYRHVIHHELVHGVMNDYMYGGSIQGLITGRIRVQIPGWVAEGLAEYDSRHKDFNTQSDMFVRDAVMEAYLPTISEMQGYAVYTVGPTIFTYMEEKYGKPKVSEFMTKLRVAGTTNATFESTFGMKEEEFNEKWQMYHRKIYFPDIAKMVSVKEIGKQLTYHDRDKNFYNITPTMAPQGDKIAYLTDKSGYADIMLISSIDGTVLKKLVSGEKTPSLEELHWLSPGMSWSPDGKQLVFAAKASDSDALLIVDVETGRITKYAWPELEGVFGGSWSPDGKTIAFTGMVHGQSDVYLMDLGSKKIQKLTDDIFSDTRPVFSRDGTKIAFVSDRRDFLSAPPKSFDITTYNYKQTDIYVMNADGSGMERITTEEMDDSWPEWGPDNTKLLYTSDRNGVSNLYVADLASKTTYAITNVLSGVFQPSLSKDGKFLAFSGFSKSGFDIYTLNNPFDQPAIDLPITISMKKFRKQKDLPETLSKEIGLGKADSAVTLTEVRFSGDSASIAADTSKAKDAGISFQNFIFSGLDDDKSKPKSDQEAEPEDPDDFVKLPERIYKTQDGEYRIRNYRVRFTPDLVYGSAGFNTLTGFSGITQMAFSDILGNHRLLFGTNLFFDLKNSTFYGTYAYLSRRTDYSVTAFHTAYSFATDYVDERVAPAQPGFDGFADSFIRYRNYGVTFSASRPFNRFNRFDVNVTQFTLARETTLAGNINGITQKSQVPLLGPTRRSTNTIIGTALTHDNSLLTYFGPFDGQRAQLAVFGSPGYGTNGLKFMTVTADARKYIWFKRFYSFAFRGSGGATYGRNPQRFFVGGLDNWILPHFTNGDIIVDTFEDFLATFVTPLRGSDYYELQGTRYFSSNFEFRFPLIHFAQLGFPLPLFLQSIRGVTFIDFGAAWGGEERTFVDQNGDEHKATYRYIDRNGNIVYNRAKFDWGQTLKGEPGPVFQDARIGYGYGIRALLGFFVLRYDVAWNIRNPRRGGGDAKHYWSIGADF